jgi:hypothetical protein
MLDFFEDFWIPIAMFTICSILGAGCCVGGCDRGYSEGDRAGVVVKFSKKGLIWKTWEGEMNLGGMRQSGTDTVVNTWGFSVMHDADVQAVKAALASGKPITIHYVQWVQGPATHIGSDYEVLSVEKPKE